MPLDSSPHFASWPPREQSFAAPANFRAPDAKGVDPTQSGWVYVKVDVFTGECKVGFTKDKVVDRLTETGAPHLALHTAFHIPPPASAFEAEQHCHGRLGRDRMRPHSMSGGASEFFPGPIEHVAHLVEMFIQGFFDYLHEKRVYSARQVAAAHRYDPQYDQREIYRMGLTRAPYWEKKFGLKGFHEAHDILHGRPPHSR